MKKYLKKSLFLAFIITFCLTNISMADVNVRRISGHDRYETALKVNNEFSKKSSRRLAVISSGYDFRYALYGSYAASALKVPFYIIPNENVSNIMLNELSLKNIKRVFIVGSYSELNESIDKALKSRGLTVTRFSDKYENGYMRTVDEYIDEELFNTFYPEQPRGDYGNSILVNDRKFPDLLSSIPLVSDLIREEGTYLGSYHNVTIPEGQSYIEGYRFIIGGKNTVPDIVRTRNGDKDGLNRHYPFYEGATEDDYYYTGRIFGADRYKTAVEIAKAFKPVMRKNIETAVIVSGVDYPDALSSGVVSTFTNGAILLTEPNKLNKDTKAFIKSYNIKNIIIVGGEKSVSKNVENELKNLN